MPHHQFWEKACIRCTLELFNFSMICLEDWDKHTISWTWLESLSFRQRGRGIPLGPQREIPLDGQPKFEGDEPSENRKHVPFGVNLDSSHNENWREWNQCFLVSWVLVETCSFSKTYYYFFFSFTPVKYRRGKRCSGVAPLQPSLGLSVLSISVTRFSFFPLYIHGHKYATRG